MNVLIYKDKGITASAPTGGQMFKYIVEKNFLDDEKKVHVVSFYVWAKTNSEAINLAFEHPFLNGINDMEEISIGINTKSSK